MKANVLNLEGKKLRDINLPKSFSSDIREDVVAKVLEAKKSQQPYAPSLVGGKQHSASGIIRHRRHVWKTHYGHGISRIPRKIVSARGNRFNWIGAEISSTVGGRRAHPPKVLSMMNAKRVNKKELKIAFNSALSATADKKFVSKKYLTLEKLDKDVPLIVSNIDKIKVKELLTKIKKLLGDNLYHIAVKKKSVRAGKGTRRGRKYKSNAGLLIVIGKDEKLKTNAFEVVNVKNLGVADLARGGLGRLTLYTEQAIKDLGELK
jgi:large subunit ribosomal protein L4e